GLADFFNTQKQGADAVAAAEIFARNGLVARDERVQFARNEFYVAFSTGALVNIKKYFAFFQLKLDVDSNCAPPMQVRDRYLGREFTHNHPAQGRFPFLSHEFFYQGKGKHPSKKPTTLQFGAADFENHA
ncbi:MAG: hypothetical protein ACFNLH_04805, partial [Corynebacterium matruchotii]